MRGVIISPLGGWRGQAGDVAERTWIAHGAATLQAFARWAGLHCDLLATRQFAGPVELARRLEGYDIVGLSAISAWVPTIREILDCVPAGATVAVGGAHCTADPTAFEDDERVSHIFEGYAELGWAELLRSGGAGMSRRVTDNDPVELDALTFIDRGEWPPERAWLGMPEPFASFITTRGCPYRCRFCFPLEQNMTGGKYLRRSPWSVRAEVEREAVSNGLRAGVIHDDTFGLDPRRLSELAGALGPLGVEWWVGTRADLIATHPERLEAFWDMGVRWVSIGFESGNDDMLRKMNKGAGGREANLRAAELLRRAGVRIFANYIFGLPGETPAQMWDTVTMIRQIAPDHHSPSVYSPFPGSEWGDALIEVGSRPAGARAPWRAYLEGQDLRLIQYCIRAARDGAMPFPAALAKRASVSVDVV